MLCLKRLSLTLPVAGLPPPPVPVFAIVQLDVASSVERRDHRAGAFRYCGRATTLPASPQEANTAWTFDRSHKVGLPHHAEVFDRIAFGRGEVPAIAAYGRQSELRFIPASPQG